MFLLETMKVVFGKYRRKIMSNNCAFTICTKSYVGYVSALKDSIKKYTDDIDFFIIVADEIDSEVDIPENVFVAKSLLKSISEEKWLEYTFKYNLTEFCTCIKPSSFLYFFNNGYERVCYFDPDLYFFDNPNVIYNYLNKYMVIVTPHCVNMEITERKDSAEFDARISGIFNFGFLGLSNTTKTNDFLKWWHNRLDDKCFFDSMNFLCTDQKWGDLLPCYFNSDELYISRNMGWNLAPWNFFEREIICKDGIWFVKNRYNNDALEKVLFAHYSGYDYKKMLDGKIIQKNDHNGAVYSDIEPFEHFYIKVLCNIKDVFLKYIDQPYSYNFFSNGRKIEKMHRRLYHSAILQGIDVGNPFCCENKKFYKRIDELLMYSNSNSDNFSDVINSAGIGRKLTIINRLMRILYKIIGYEKYLSVLKLFQAYNWYENQYHFLDTDKNVLFFRKRII